jgi:hypothetical protein
MNDTPEIKCSQENDQFVFDCEKCGQKHYHSAYEGHRSSHCEPGAYPNGYILKKA